MTVEARQGFVDPFKWLHKQQRHYDVKGTFQNNQFPRSFQRSFQKGWWNCTKNSQRDDWFFADNFSAHSPSIWRDFRLLMVSLNYGLVW